VLEIVESEAIESPNDSYRSIASKNDSSFQCSVGSGFVGHFCFGGASQVRSEEFQIGQERGSNFSFVHAFGCWGLLLKPAGDNGCRFEVWSSLLVSKAKSRKVHFFFVKGEPASVS